MFEACVLGGHPESLPGMLCCLVRLLGSCAVPAVPARPCCAVELERAVAGDIVSIAGVAAAGIADTVAAPEVLQALPPGGHPVGRTVIGGGAGEGTAAEVGAWECRAGGGMFAAAADHRWALQSAGVPSHFAPDRPTIGACTPHSPALRCPAWPRCRQDRPPHPQHGVWPQHLAAGGPRGQPADGHEDRGPPAGACLPACLHRAVVHSLPGCWLHHTVCPALFAHPALPLLILPPAPCPLPHPSSAAGGGRDECVAAGAGGGGQRRGVVRGAGARRAAAGPADRWVERGVGAVVNGVC